MTQPNRLAERMAKVREHYDSAHRHLEANHKTHRRHGDEAARRLELARANAALTRPAGPADPAPGSETPATGDSPAAGA